MAASLFNDTVASRFEIEVEGKTVFADYRLEGSNLAILHVETPPELRGKGAAGELMQLIANHAALEKQNIVPVCGYASAWLKRHTK